jgi:hypothetical protein
LGARSFTPSKPLTQKELLDLIFYAGYRGQLPSDIKPGGSVWPKPRFDDYLVKSEAQRLIHRLLGKELTYWSGPRIVDGVLGWYYNTGNTMYASPYTRVTKFLRTLPTVANVQFVVWHKPHNLTLDRPLRKVGNGNAILKWNGSNWIVTHCNIPNIWRRVP